MADLASARALLAKFRPWLDKYRGGMPAGWMATIMSHESGGNFGAAGDASLGEVGYFQIAAYVPPLFGYPASARTDPESNVAIAALEYALEAAKWKLRYPNLVELGTADSWKLARLSFAVGRAGSYQLADAAKSILRRGAVYDGILQWVAAYGAPSLGSQSSDKVRNRVVDIQNQWNIARAIDSTSPGPPTLIPNPPAGPYQIPADVRPFFRQPIPAILLIILAGGSGLLYFLWKRTR